MEHLINGLILKPGTRLENDGDYDLAVGNDDPWYTVSVLLNQSK